MEDDQNRLANSLRTKWNLILESILEENENSQLLDENNQTIYRSLDELNRSLHQLSQYRHHLNCRLEVIKKEVETLQGQANHAEGAERASIDQSVIKLEEEGHALQMELGELEHQLKEIRVKEREHTIHRESNQEK